MYLDTDQYDKAEASYKEALAIEEDLAAKHSFSLDYVTGVGETYTDLGLLFRDRKPEQSIAWYDKAIQTWQNALAREPQHRAGHAGLEQSHANRAVALAHLGKLEQASHEVDALADNKTAPENLYALGAACAVCSQQASRNQGARNAQRRALADREASRAIEQLRRAFKDGYRRIERLQKDTCLDSLRSREDFKKLVREVTTPKSPAK